MSIDEYIAISLGVVLNPIVVSKQLAVIHVTLRRSGKMRRR